jgi:hypothetical protein
LDTIEPVLDASIRRLNSAHRAVALAAAELAVSEAGVEDVRLMDALATLRVGSPLSVRQQEELTELEAEFDDIYFKLEAIENDPNASEKSRSMYRKARAVSSVLCAGLPDDFEAASEATYEAIAAVPDPKAVVDAITHLLEAYH